jgi:adenylylsulfate kinase-like enzyme
MAKHLFPQKIKCYVLDGDKPLKGIIGHLGFSESDKSENIRTVAEIAH